MKKIMICLISLLCLTACTNESKNGTNNQNLERTMYIKPTEFSEETKDVLSLFGNELAFFDISIDDTVKSYTMSIWLYENGEWKQSELLYGETEEGDFLPNRWAIRLNDNKIELYSLYDTGKVKYEHNLIYFAFEDTMAELRWRLPEEQNILLNKEMILYAFLGSNDSRLKVYNNIESIDEIECDAGIVITINFSDQLSN